MCTGGCSLCELLVRAGENEEAAQQAERLAEIHCARGELDEAESAYHMAAELEPRPLEFLAGAIHTSVHDPCLHYLSYIRYGDRLFEDGEIDAALDNYRSARGLNDERPQLIQKCIDCISLVAPEAEAIPDYVALAERYMAAGEATKARKVYEHIGRVDPFNADARAGLAKAVEAERSPRSISNSDTQKDRQVLGRRPDRQKRVALEELLAACQDAVSSSTKH
jgi:tetratricopeptide (TPR) repeat protein